jgi:RNA polymerase sigma factor (sigma-70 family)
VARIDPKVERRLRQLQPAIVRAAHRLNLPMELDDLISVGMAKTWQLLSRRDYEDKDLGLVVTKAKWAMRDYLRWIRPGKKRNPVKVLSLDDIMSDTGRRMRFQPICRDPSPLEQLEMVEDARRHQARIGGLSKRDAVIVAQLMRGHKQCEIARDLGVSQPRVSQILKRIKRQVLGT